MYLRLSGAFHGTCVLFASQTRPILYLRFFEKSKIQNFGLMVSNMKIIF